MRRLCLLYAILAIAGCGRNPESQIVGTWHVDPASISMSRLQPGADKRPDWTDAVDTMSRINLTFANQPNSVTATGMDETSKGTWALRGDTIEVQSKSEQWPQMVIDPRVGVIHLTMDRNGDQLRFDLVKVK